MHKSNSYLKLKKYFQNLVEQSNFLNDFSGYFSRELHNKEQSSKGLKSPCLALFGYSLGIEGEAMASTAIRRVSFGILYNNVPPDDYEKQYERIDNAEELALRVVARIKLDSNTNGHLLYNSLIKNSVEVRPIELEGVGIFGAEVFFNLKNPQHLKVSTDDWKDLDKIC
ncbi:hypothetical protein [Riemerella anatipestifer]|uniref:hypothetical protein n=1 Tax=Riemerella anatipestifer TaxID=34085 RepID=UPI001C1E5BD0|nr:hypothetical protein [Riemerella anatipestifer]MCW0492494.1 hypothetical protein [Riemerella anatipestifer]MDR7749961.1 hypothetical protein [Riemerella anatipestifer]MDR7752195.1 hypothetical protein [Riemerella anatipestifer]MDR7754192.1 hypothetical protein [Riemerella anatipestifer]MDR7758461.1 hypothetical protein [Riemerella anatipestifer]